MKQNEARSGTGYRGGRNAELFVQSKKNTKLKDKLVDNRRVLACWSYARFIR